VNTYLLLFVVAGCSALVITPLVRRLCEHFGLLDVPRDERRVHRKAVPRLGGVALFASILIALALLPLIDNLLTASLKASRSQLFIVMIPATFVFLFGVYDDLRGTNARYKFVAQGLAGLLFYWLGGRVETLSIPLLGTVFLPAVIGCAITVVWTVAVSNAFNLIDGMDGLATGAALFASLVLLAVSLMLGHPVVTVLSVAMCGALIGFLRYNFNPASIFLGDSGALFIGFVLAALSVQGTQKASTAVAVAIPVIAFALPVLDTGFAVVRRFIGGKPLFEGDREHIHHKLLERGWSQRRASLVLYSVCALFGMLALLFVNESGMRTTGLVLFVVGVAILFLMDRLRYHEVDEVKAGVRHNLTERRLRIANNVRVRRASQVMSEAASLAEIFNSIRELLEVGEFVYATVQIGRGGDAENNERMFVSEREALAGQGVELRGGLIQWAWERGDVEGAEILNSGYFWTLRLPLSTEQIGWGYLNLYRAFGDDNLLLDINYLCDLFRRELSQAAERVFCANEFRSGAEELSVSARSGA
jgi:UDP-GlcNAc:undecaprenyl-phosphate GlcNAc-1-phosphate transferase